MSNTAKIIKKELAKSGGTARMVKVPPERRPTIETIKKIQREINAQINVKRSTR